MTDMWVSAILGIVEGLTEFLPVSSTGHLIVAGHMLGFTGATACCFEVFIQLGAILAVVVLYWRRFLGLWPKGGFLIGSAEGFRGFRGLWLLALTTLPPLVGGYLAHKAIKENLFGPVTVAWALGIGGVAILLAEWLKPPPKADDLDGLNGTQALAIGLFQCLSLWPGVSRSAATIVGGLLVGLDRKVAAEYSFLAAVPVMIAATSYDLCRSWCYLNPSDFGFFAVGFAVSFVSALVAIESFVMLVQRWSLSPFAYYRIAIAPVIYFCWG